MTVLPVQNQPPVPRVQCPDTQSATRHGALAQYPGTQAQPPAAHRQKPPIHTAPGKGATAATSTRGGGGTARVR